MSPTAGTPAQHALVTQLIDARRSRHPVREFRAAAPLSLDDAYSVQALHVRALLTLGGSSPIGYKIGCTNKSAQQLLHLDHPFHGRLIASHAHESPAQLPASDFMMRCIEAEFAFRMGADLPPRPTAYVRADIEAAIATVMPAIEIVDSRYFDWTKVGALALIADNGCTGHWVKGAEQADWRTFDLEHERVALKVNGEIERVGKGAQVMGHPLNALVFLANDLIARGSFLRQGDLVSTGTSIDVWFAGNSDRIEADFGPLGEVLLTFS